MQQLSKKTDGVWVATILFAIAKAVRDLLVSKMRGIDALAGSEAMPKLKEAP